MFLSEFESVSGQKLECRLWPVRGKPKGIVQLVHGMAEHINRYEKTAEALNKAGYIVVGHTHIGHGKRAIIKGYFGEKNGWDSLVQDVHRLRMLVQKEYPSLPYFLLGHSMGSFVVRTYCQKYEKGLSGVILSGTGHFIKPVVTFGKGVAKVLCSLGQSKKPSKLLQKISSAGYLKGYEDVQSPFDWLTTDRDIVRNYEADEYCGFTFTAKGYWDMFDGLSRLYPENIAKMKRKIPILLLSGEDDPVGGHGKGIKAIAEEYRKAGLKDVTVLLYPKGRHEMFNEKDREKAWSDLIQWMNSKKVAKECKR